MGWRSPGRVAPRPDIHAVWNSDGPTPTRGAEAVISGTGNVAVSGDCRLGQAVEHVVEELRSAAAPATPNQPNMEGASGSILYMEKTTPMRTQPALDRPGGEHHGCRTIATTPQSPTTPMKAGHHRM